MTDSDVCRRALGCEWGGGGWCAHSVGITSGWLPRIWGSIINPIRVTPLFHYRRTVSERDRVPRRVTACYYLSGYTLHYGFATI